MPGGHLVILQERQEKIDFMTQKEVQ